MKSSLAKNRSERPERGAALVEFALVAVLLVSLVLGVFEVGVAWSDHQSLTQASRSGARVASQLGVLPQADHEALRAIEAGFGNTNTTIARVVIYEAGVNGEMPSACETAVAGYNGAANCNVYDSTSIAALNNPILWGSGTSCGTADNNWCSATDRSNAQASASYVGVHVEMERSWVAGFFGVGTHTMTETTVMRIEPGL